MWNAIRSLFRKPYYDGYHCTRCNDEGMWPECSSCERRAKRGGCYMPESAIIPPGGPPPPPAKDD